MNADPVHRRRRLPLLGLAALVVLAAPCSVCNLLQSATSQPALAPTVTVAALVTTQATSTAALATPTMVASATATTCVPTVVATQDANVRSGPGPVYDVVGALLTGSSAVVDGKDSSSTWWYIELAAAPGGHGWVWGQVVTPSCIPQSLQVVAAPPTPTPTPSLPAAPTNVAIAKACQANVPAMYLYLGTLTWKNKANNAKGYKIYFNGGLLATLPPNSTSFPVPGVVLVQGTVLTMGVQAFNDAGASNIVTATMSCP